MQAERTPKRLEFEVFGKRRVTGVFDGGQETSGGGAPFFFVRLTGCLPKPGVAPPALPNNDQLLPARLKGFRVRVRAYTAFLIPARESRRSACAGRPIDGA